MKVSILTIGDEILNGSTLDTNATFMAQNAIKKGLNIEKILSVSDKNISIIEGLNFLRKKSDVIFVTGGLGPTKDDITVKTLAKYVKQPLVFNNDIYTRINKMLSVRALKNVMVDKDRCRFPKGAILLKNKKGTAPCLWIKTEGLTIVSMPGVPLEMKQIFIDEVLPKIATEFKTENIINKYILTAGIWESAIAKKICTIEELLPSNISLAYLPKLGQVKLRLTGVGTDTKTMEKHQKNISKKLGSSVFSFNEQDSLELIIGKLLVEKNATISTAESCTGGKIAHRITCISGSSAYFEGGIISYSNNIKTVQLGVEKSTLETFGAVSEQTVVEMAKGALKALKTDYSIAVTGIAGPSGGTVEKPVGTVWIAVANNQKVVTRLFNFWPFREENIELSTIAALNMLRKFIS